MKQKIHFTIVFAAVFFSFISCVKEENNDEKYRPAGTQIPFSAVSSYENGDGTRAEYSGQLYGSSPLIERIDWKANDPMTIVYSHGSTWDDAVYTVSSVTTNSSHNEYSDAVVTSSSPLVWAGGETGHTFYGMYPTYSTDSYSSINHNTVKGRIPDSQPVDANNTLSVTETENNSTITYDKYQPDTKNHGYMVAYLNIPGSSVSTNVTLPFRPAVTTFEFKFRRKSGDANSKIASIVLSSDSSTGSDLCGDFQFDITGLNNNGTTQWGTVSTPTGGSRGRSITVDLPSGGVAAPETGYLDFSILALPITQKKLTLTINYVNNTPAAKHIDFKTGDTWREFEGGKKYVITNVQVPGGEWIYTIDEIRDYILTGADAGHGNVDHAISVKSYKYTNQNSNNKIAVPWKIQYTTDNGSTWTDLPSGGYNGFTASARTGSGGNSGESSTIRIPGTNTTETHVDPSGLDTATPPGTATSASPYDLSMASGSRNTANCYIVTAPGVYMFPCVYGNAIKNGNVNYSAFLPIAATNDAVSETGNRIASTLAEVNEVYNKNNKPDIYYTPGFYNVLGGYIAGTDSEYIVSDLARTGAVSDKSAAVIWQDVPQGDEIIPYESGYIGMTTVSNRDYIWFKIDSDHIKPGNIVIALIGTVAGTTISDNILWSWHIWIPNPNNAPSVASSFMSVNLGEVTQEKVTKFKDRSLKFRVIQTDGTNNTMDTEEFTFSQEGDASNTTVTRNTYYQWGRKDPMINTNEATDVSINPDYDNHRGEFFTSFQGFTFNANDIDRPRGIRAPWMLLNNSQTNSWLDGDVYPYYASSDNLAWTITNQHLGPFTSDDKTYLDNNTPFNSNGGWTIDNNNYRYVTKAGNAIKWTGIEAAYLGNRAFFSGAPFDLSTEMTQVDQSENLWVINYDVRVTTAQVTQMNNLKNNNYLTASKVNSFVETGNGIDYHYNLTLASGDSFPSGPYTSTQATYLISTGVYVLGDFNYTTARTYNNFSDGATRRSLSSIPYNLWNSYLYSENPRCSSVYSNKFKTIYDPCPPGFTVPTKNQLNVTNYYSRGSYSSSSDSGYTGANGYWTDHPCAITPIDVNNDLTVLSNFKNYNKAYWKTTDDAQNTTTTRSTAASIRPMVDPK